MSELSQNDQFLILLTSHQRRLTGYLRTLVLNRADAEELLQETNLYLCHHADEFQLGTDFAAWALRIAHFRVLAWRERQSRDRLVFNESLLERLASAAQSSTATSDRRRDALEKCLEKLPSHEHQLVMQLYGDRKVSPQRLAERVGRSTKGIYASLSRIRLRLFECIQRTLAAEDRS